RSKCRSTPVYAVESISLHVIRKPTRTSDPGDKYDLLLGNVELGHQPLHLGEDRIVAATWTPSHFLIRDKVLSSQFRRAIGAVRAFCFLTHIFHSSRTTGIQ